MSLTKAFHCNSLWLYSVSEKSIHLHLFTFQFSQNLDALPIKCSCTAIYQNLVKAVRLTIHSTPLCKNRPGFLPFIHSSREQRTLFFCTPCIPRSDCFPDVSLNLTLPFQHSFGDCHKRNTQHNWHIFYGNTGFECPPPQKKKKFCDITKYNFCLFVQLLFIGESLVKRTMLFNEFQK